MSDRLKELQHQRALAQEQLAWLEREIARETGSPTPPPAVVPTVPPAPAGPASATTRPVTPPPGLSPEEILARYRTQGRPMHEEARRGCIIYFIAGMTMLVLGICAFLLLKYK